MGTKQEEQKTTVDLELAIGKKVFGQAQAITALADSVYIAQSGLKELTKPIGSYLVQQDQQVLVKQKLVLQLG